MKKKIFAALFIISFLHITLLSKECSTLDTSSMKKCADGNSAECKDSDLTVCIGTLTVKICQAPGSQPEEIRWQGEMNLKCMDFTSALAKCTEHTTQTCYKKVTFKCENYVYGTCKFYVLIRPEVKAGTKVWEVAASSGEIGAESKDDKTICQRQGPYGQEVTEGARTYVTGD